MSRPEKIRITKPKTVLFQKGKVYDVIEWNDSGDPRVCYDGDYAVAVSSSEWEPVFEETEPDTDPEPEEGTVVDNAAIIVDTFLKELKSHPAATTVNTIEIRNQPSYAPDKRPVAITKRLTIEITQYVEDNQ
jgi:cation diffusion facilitator CzcD-associated flavoprotein CzcO